MIELVDEIRTVIGAPAVASLDATVDDSCADPVAWEANTLYAFESEGEADVHEPEGDGSIDREIFEVTLVYISAADDENRMGPRHRETSVTLDAVKEAAMTLIRGNRERSTTDPDSGATVQLWADLRGRGDMGFVRALNLRGVAIRVRGYRFIPGLN